MCTTRTHRASAAPPPPLHCAPTPQTLTLSAPWASASRCTWWRPRLSFSRAPMCLRKRSIASVISWWSRRGRRASPTRSSRRWWRAGSTSTTPRSVFSTRLTSSRTTRAASPKCSRLLPRTSAPMCRCADCCASTSARRAPLRPTSRQVPLAHQHRRLTVSAGAGSRQQQHGMHGGASLVVGTKSAYARLCVRCLLDHVQATVPGLL
mmetsp:Transcript_35588/g.61026  ORF Transcript_35588/g.61026 Transcript_35588/m.61026 type:complete len:207 (-) Transcript_35588:32-652(-)